VARQFVAFVASAEGANVFQSWGWGSPPANVVPAIVDGDISLACRIRDDAWTNDIGKGLARLQGLIDDYRLLGVPPEHVHVTAILDGDAGYWMLNDQAYSAYQPRSQENPNRKIVEELLAAGVSFELSAETMEQYDWSETDILPGVRVVSGAKRRITTLSQQGYKYVPF
jgi:intracellular sulfur oxidation DsrE/DsrF family protein